MYEIDQDGNFLCDILGEPGDGVLWVADQIHQPAWSPRYVGFSVTERNQAVGGRWDDPGRPELEVQQ